jgi:multidrug efflux pump subunit AcrA (membrane-fusion protein)
LNALAMPPHVLTKGRKFMTIGHFWKPLVRLSILTLILVGSFLPTACGSQSLLPDNGQEADVTAIPTPIIPTKPTYTVQRGEVVNEIEFTGRITPVKEVELSFHTNGYIREIFFQRGEAVKAGQIMADLEVSDLENQLAQAQLSLKTSETHLIAAQQLISDTLTEARILLAVEQIKLEQAKYSFKASASKTQEYNLRLQEQMFKLAQFRVERLERGVDPQLVLAVESTRLTVQRLEAQFADAQIIAPLDGVITSINIFNEGQAVTAYAPVITVGDMSQLEVSADLYGDSGVGELSQGMAAVIEPHDRPGTVQMMGIIRYVPTGAPGEEDKTTRVSFETSIADTDLGLSDLVRVKVVVESKTNVLWLPPQAIRTFEGRQFVVVQDAQGLHRVDVKVGVEGSERVEILSGLTEGQIVQAP